MTGHQEKMYRENFFQFAKKCTEGTLTSSQAKPEFTQDEADKFYHERYTRTKVQNLGNLYWFPWLPNSNDACFNMDAIRPKHIKEMLRAKKPTSAPGNDGILYGLLRKLPTTHRFIINCLWLRCSLNNYITGILRIPGPTAVWPSSIRGRPEGSFQL